MVGWKKKDGEGLGVRSRVGVALSPADWHRRWAWIGLALLVACDSQSADSIPEPGPLCAKAGGVCDSACPSGLYEGVVWTGPAPAAAQDCNPAASGNPAFTECCLVTRGDADAGAFCSADLGIVAPPTVPTLSVIQCAAAQPFCELLVDASAPGWGCCATAVLPDGGAPATNECTPASSANGHF
jgi:hypothetical protein